MAKRTLSRTLTDETLRESLAARAERLSAPVSGSAADPAAHFSAAVSSATVPASTDAPGTPLPLIEPIWSFWLDAAQLAYLTTAFAARQINASKPSPPRGIPKVDLPPPVIELLTAWFKDHRDGTRAAAREANYLAHYGLRLPGGRGGVRSSPFLDAFHAMLREAIHSKETSQPSDASTLLFLLRRLHLHLSRSASLIVDGLPTPDVFPRLGESLSLGRADLLLAQWLLAIPEIAAALRGHILVPYPEKWMAPLDQLRRVTRTIDSLSVFYYDLAVTSEALLLSIRFGNWMQSSAEAAANWATFWHAEIARYLVAFDEVTNSGAATKR
jgi:hypothetical protein